jgi:hypothetical protein
MIDLFCCLHTYSWCMDIQMLQAKYSALAPEPTEAVAMIEGSDRSDGARAWWTRTRRAGNEYLYVYGPGGAVSLHQQSAKRFHHTIQPSYRPGTMGDNYFRNCPQCLLPHRFDPPRGGVAKGACNEVGA